MGTEAFLGFALAVLLCLLVVAVVGLIRVIVVWIASRGMGKIYWNEKEGQIMTKGGKCLYDTSNFDELCNRLGSIEASLACTKDRTLKSQLQCAAKGHGKWVLGGKDNGNESVIYRVFWGDKGLTTMQDGICSYVFKCSKCGLEITKTKKELTPKEREALGKLGL